MTADQIADVLRLHGMWVRGEAGGQHANLQYANLQGADLQGADLQGADLRGAFLRDADLRGADLRGAVGCIRLPVGDPRGYDVVAVWHGDDWMIAAGCRWLPFAEARAHWGERYSGSRHIGDRYIYALDWLETNAEATKASQRAMEDSR